jgi:hypothetical protein
MRLNTVKTVVAALCVGGLSSHGQAAHSASDIEKIVGQTIGR